MLPLVLTRVDCAPAAVRLNANRHVTGVLRGFDQFMNLVLDGTVDEKLKQDIGMVVSYRMTLPSARTCSRPLPLESVLKSLLVALLWC